MTFREANNTDIKQIQIVRNAVTENTLSDPGLVTDADCLEFITQRGKGWVCEIDNQIVGFSIADLKGNNIWALFVHPSYDKQGIGRQLHDLMLNWYFKQTSKKFGWEQHPIQEQKFFIENWGGKKLALMEREN